MLGVTTYDIQRSIEANQTPPTEEQVAALAAKIEDSRQSTPRTPSWRIIEIPSSFTCIVGNCNFDCDCSQHGYVNSPFIVVARRVTISPGLGLDYCVSYQDPTSSANCHHWRKWTGCQCQRIGNIHRIQSSSTTSSSHTSLIWTWLIRRGESSYSLDTCNVNHIFYLEKLAMLRHGAWRGSCKAQMLYYIQDLMFEIPDFWTLTTTLLPSILWIIQTWSLLFRGWCLWWPPRWPDFNIPTM